MNNNQIKKVKSENIIVYLEIKKNTIKSVILNVFKLLNKNSKKNIFLQIFKSNINK